MSWVDTMRLRRRATAVRAVGWGNLGICTIGSIVEYEAAALMMAFAVLLMATTYTVAHLIDKRADRLITR